MKVKVVSRSSKEYERSTNRDVPRVFKNVDPALHPFERAREYKRALNAVKLNRLFAKPFIGALSGHMDSPVVMAKHPLSLPTLMSGSADGEVKLWDLPTKSCRFTIGAHRGFVRGLAVMPNGTNYLTCGDDKKIKQWRLPSPDTDFEWEEDLDVPLTTYVGSYAFTNLSIHESKPLFATTSRRIEIWSHGRTTAPVQKLTWGVETITTVAFNKVEQDVLAAASTDRNVMLYDVRLATALKKVTLHMRANQIAWNPMEAFNFTVASEDGNCYSFDMRKLDKAQTVHKDHVGAVLAIDFSPTGEEFVTGSYDRTIRIFGRSDGHSREVYHTARMQRVMSVAFSQDARYVLCGADDTNIRLWKAEASKPITILASRQRTAYEYRDRLVKRYKHIPLVRKIHRQRHLPKAVKKAAYLHHVMRQSRVRKEGRRRRHSAPGIVPFKPERRRHIVKVED